MTGYAHGAVGVSASDGQPPRAHTVSQALDIVKGTLKGIRLTVIGEVSEVSAKRGYKAVYFTIKDRSSALKCLMWNDLYRASGLDLEVGQEVEVSGFFSLYAARGTMNFDVRRLSLAEHGRLLAQHGLAGAQEPNRPLLMHAVGQREVDRIHVRILHEAKVRGRPVILGTRIALCRINVKLPGKSVEPLGATPRDRNQPRALDMRERSREPAGNAARAHDAPTNLSHVRLRSRESFPAIIPSRPVAHCVNASTGIGRDPHDPQAPNESSQPSRLAPIMKAHKSKGTM